MASVKAMLRVQIYALLQRRFHKRLERRGASLGRATYVSRGSRIVAKTVLGDGTRIIGPCVLKGSEPIVIGRYCAIGDGVRIISSNHETNRANLQRHLQSRLGFGALRQSRGPVTIGNNVWIGDAAIILSGVVVGDGAVIAAGSVVTRSVPPFAIVAGSPARVVRRRFSEQVIERLTSIEWWEWPEERISANPELFQADLASDDCEGVLLRVR